MTLGKSKLGLLLILVLILMVSGSARVYIPQDVNQNFPEYASSDGSNKLDIYSYSPNGDDKTDGVVAKSVGPIMDFDNDSEIEVAGVDGSSNLIIYERSTYSEDYSYSVGAKTGDRPMAVGNFDGDVYPDIIFSDGSGTPEYIDYNDNNDGTDIVSSSPNTIYVGDIADIDRDGYRELVSSNGNQDIVAYNYNQPADPNSTVTVIADKPKGSGGNGLKAAVSSALADIDDDDRLEYSFHTGSSSVYHYDTVDGVTKYGKPGSLKAKRFGYTLTDFVSGGGLLGIETMGTGNSNKVLTCEVSGACREDTPADRKQNGIQSYVPPFVKQPVTNGTAVDGSTVVAKFNVTDIEGYSDILDTTAEANFTSPNGSSYLVNADEFTKNSAVPGSSKAGGFVPKDGKTKAFKASFTVQTAGQWNVSVQIKDEKMTGTKNWTTFEVEKAVVEKNVTQNISMGRKDTSRQTSLGKSQITGLSFASTGLSNSFINRLLTESLGFSSGKDRKQSLRKGLSSSFGVSRTVSNFKASFPIFSSVFSVGSAISDVYATETVLQDLLGISDATSDEALFTGALRDGFGLQTSQGKGIAQGLVELVLGISPDEGRSVGLNRTSQEALGLGSSASPTLSLGRVFIDDLGFLPQNRVQQDVLRLLSESVGVDLLGTRDQSIQRLDNNTITGSSSFSATSDATRLILEAFSQDSTLLRSDLSVTRLLSQNFSTSGRFGEPLATGLVNIALGVDQSFERSSTVLGRILLSDFLASDSQIGELTSVRGTNQTLAAGNRIGATGLFFGSSTQSLGVEQSIRSLPNFIVSVTQLLQTDGSQSSSTLLQRSSDLNLNLSNSNSRNILVLRSVSSGLSPSFTPSVFDGTIAVVQQLIGLSSGETDTLVSPRTQDTGVGVSSGISESQTVFRSFTQSLIASTAPSFLEGFIDDLVNSVVCRIFGQDSAFCDIPEDTEDSSPSDDSDDGSGGGGGGGIGSIGGQNQTQVLDNGTESSNNMKQDKDVANRQNKSLPDANRSSSISYNVSVEAENDSKASVQLENVSSGEKVSLNIQEKPRDESQTSKSSQDSETTEDQSIELESISFEVERESKDSAINVTTVENSSKLNITSENKIYKATEISTSVETDGAGLIYDVKKSFLSQNNATKNDLVVNRWKNSSIVQSLPTKVLNESASNLTVKAVSPNGFSIFTVGLENTTSNTTTSSREFNFEYTFPNVQLSKIIKAILILSSLYLIRYPLFRTLSTLDIRVSYVIGEIHLKVLELYRSLRWWMDAEEGREEFSLADEVNSLRNRKEALQFKKKRLEKEVERKKELRNRHSMRLELLANKVEKWKRKLDV